MFHSTQPTRLSRVYVVYDNITQFKKANLFFILKEARLGNFASSFGCVVFCLNQDLQDFGIDRIVNFTGLPMSANPEKGCVREFGLFV